jgi:hypothetical protein
MQGGAQRLIFLNVPARQSKGYFDYLYSNIHRDHIVFVDALFGGLDVAGRLKWSGEHAERFVHETVVRLVQGNKPEEATICNVDVFFDAEKALVRENFIIVICRFMQDMRDIAHQKSFLEFVQRRGLKRSLRFAAVASDFGRIDGIAPPFYLNEDIKLAEGGKVVILEFSVRSLDDPRFIVMDELQQFHSIVTTRTFFGVNYGREKIKGTGEFVLRPFGWIKEWVGPLLNLRRLLGW